MGIFCFSNNSIARFYLSSRFPRGPNSRLRSSGLRPKATAISLTFVSSRIRACPISSTFASPSEPPSIRRMACRSSNRRNNSIKLSTRRASPCSMFSGEQSIRLIAPSPTAFNSRFISSTAAAISSGVIFRSSVMAFLPVVALLRARLKILPPATGRLSFARVLPEQSLTLSPPETLFPCLAPPRQTFFFHFSNRAPAARCSARLSRRECFARAAPFFAIIRPCAPGTSFLGCCFPVALIPARDKRHTPSAQNFSTALNPQENAKRFPRQTSSMTVHHQTLRAIETEPPRSVEKCAGLHDEIRPHFSAYRPEQKAIPPATTTAPGHPAQLSAPAQYSRLSVAMRLQGRAGTRSRLVRVSLQPSLLFADLY